MRGNQMILEVKGHESRANAASLVGKRVVWKSPAGKEIHGKIVGPHGNSGAVRARFNRGMPGQAIGGRAELVEKAEKTKKTTKKPKVAKPTPAKPAKPTLAKPTPAKATKPKTEEK